MNQTIYYRIAEYKDGRFYSLYHANPATKSRLIPTNEWVTDSSGLVFNPGAKVGTQYEKGFHLFDSIDAATHYLKRFKNKNSHRYVVVAVLAKDVWKKPTKGSTALLAKSICLIGRVIQ